MTFFFCEKEKSRIVLMWDGILEVLENVAEDTSNRDKKYAASSLLKQECFEYVFILHLMIRLLGATNDLSRCLQRKDQNIHCAVGMIEATLKKINHICEEQLFEEVSSYQIWKIHCLGSLRGAWRYHHTNLRN